MGTEILKSFGVLQSELEQAKDSLKGFDENIKRLIGRDPSEILPRPGVKRSIVQHDDSRTRTRTRHFGHDNDEVTNKKRNVSVFKRLSDRPVHSEEDSFQQPQKQMISKVIVTPREVPSRQEALAAQNSDEKFKARNRRMFGALLGTLQKFQQEESKLKVKEAKRAQVEKKIEEHEIREKAEIKKEKQELFFNRKKKQAEIRMIELKMTRMREYALWEEHHKSRIGFICTKTKPHIYYLPRKVNDASKALIATSKIEVEKIIEKRREEISSELQHIEDRMRKNFENRKFKDKGFEQTTEMEIEAHHDGENMDNSQLEADNLMNVEGEFINDQLNIVNEESQSKSENFENLKEKESNNVHLSVLDEDVKESKVSEDEDEKENNTSDQSKMVTITNEKE